MSNRINKIELLQFVYDLVRTNPTITLGAMSPIASDKAEAMKEIATAIGKRFPAMDDIHVATVNADLLAACKALLANGSPCEDCEDSACGGPLTGRCVCTCHHQITQAETTARAVIAEAEGKEP